MYEKLYLEITRLFFPFERSRETGKHFAKYLSTRTGQNIKKLLTKGMCAIMDVISCDGRASAHRICSSVHVLRAEPRDQRHYSMVRIILV